jgi:hypothetical protein
MNMERYNHMQTTYMEAVCAIQGVNFLTDVGLARFMYHIAPNHCEVRRW